MPNVLNSKPKFNKKRTEAVAFLKNDACLSTLIFFNDIFFFC